MLKQQIQNTANEALKASDQILLSTLRLLLAAIGVKEKEKRYKNFNEETLLSGEDLGKKFELSDEEIIDVVSSEIKKRKDAIVLYERGNRPELVEKEQREIEVLKKYLPKQLSSEEVKKLIEESIAKIRGEIKDPSASSGQVMGKVMADLSPKIKGKADSGEVSKLVKELLSK